MTPKEENHVRIEQLESQLIRSEARIAELERAVEDCAEQARSATEEMQQFVYAVSHDLRQPLRGVLTNAQLLERVPGIQDQVQEFTSAIIQGSVEMNALIERLLTYSRVASNLRRTVVPLGPVVQWAVMSMGKLVTEAGAQVIYNGLPVVDVDDSVMSTLFQLLFTNSILYRSADPPRIDVTSEESEACHVISVRDNGCGIKPEFHEKVFAPFQRLHGKEIPGFGLGLSICRKIVRAHGGKIWVESDGTYGSTFRFTIPA